MEDVRVFEGIFGKGGLDLRRVFKLIFEERERRR